MEQKPLWQADKNRKADSNMQAFIKRVAKTNKRIKNYNALYQWSIEQPEAFWQQVWDFCDIRAEKTWDKVIETSAGLPGYRWFSGGRLNFAANLLKHAQGEHKNKAAIVFTNECGTLQLLSYHSLYQNTIQLAHALKNIGVGKGDRVAGLMPNLPETIIAMLATTALGAIWTSCSPDFGLHGIMERFGQIKPKVLFTTDGYYYKGRIINITDTVRRLQEDIPELEKTIMLPYVQHVIKEADSFYPFLNRTAAKQFTFEGFEFDHPVYIMYSSGTTGRPKCIVHGAGGTLLQHLKELQLHTDVKPQDKLFYHTTCGWMMWNWMVSALATGATLLLYDGCPTHPKEDILFDFAQKQGMTIFGTSAKYIASMEKLGIKPARSHDLSALRTILSTGSPLLPQSFHYVYREIKEDVHLASISGGTDIISCFALGNPLQPVYEGKLQGAGLGMAVQVYNDKGKPVKGQKGELVCKPPFPSMPVYFWDDNKSQKYKAAYFSKWEGIWAHGDFAMQEEDGSMIIYGRSDAVLNPGGIRIGTAEIYRLVEQMPEVEESLAIGQQWRGDVRIVLFVRLSQGYTLDETLKQNIRLSLKQNASPRHVPAKIIQVPDIPRTISGKITELAVRNVVHHQPVKNTDALANPKSLHYFENIPELEAD